VPRCNDAQRSVLGAGVQDLEVKDIPSELIAELESVRDGGVSSRNALLIDGCMENSVEKSTGRIRISVHV
jgi:hypothetical protein